MDALSKEANVPAITDFNAKLAIIERLFGAIEPNPPIKIAIELKLANPHKAKLIIITVLSESVGISGAKLE